MIILDRHELSIDRAPGAGIMFHHFHGGDHPIGQGSINATEFSDLIEFVGYKRILDAEDWLARAKSNALKPGDLCITFDDGLACQYEIALPILEAYGIKAFWFIYTSPFEEGIQRLEVYRYLRDVAYPNIESFYNAFYECVEGTEYCDLVSEGLKSFSAPGYLAEFPFYTNDDRKFRFVRDKLLGPDKYFEIMDCMVLGCGFDPLSLSRRLFISKERALALSSAGHVIGLHSHSHPTQLSALSRCAQKAEYEENKMRLEEVLERPIRVMSHPCNSYTADTLKVLREIGVNVGFRSNMAELDGRTSLEFPREDHANLITHTRISRG
jgi:peptidoglycan/xylan/chitin deacetylase (PgdA/CDA1 family)